MNSRSLVFVTVALAAFTACSKKDGGDAPWREANARLEKAHNLKMRIREVPGTDVPPQGEAGKAQSLSALPKITIAPGVTATLTWGKGALLETLEMEKGAVYPSQHLEEEVITVVRAGSGTIDVGGKSL